MENKVHWLAPVAPHATSPTQNPVLSTGNPPLTLHTPTHERLIALKNEIDRVAPVGYWDDAKKITNPYEYIFLSLQRRMPWSIASKQPLSRSYFKMIELWDLLELTAEGTSHSAEGPGGFLEAIQDRMGSAIPMIAMTLKSTERTVPGWRKSHSFLLKYPDVHITYGADGTGNLYSLANQDAFTAAAADRLPQGKACVYTADGGFDFSADFNGQESTVQRLLIAEALAGLTTLKTGGVMILKLFDMKSRATLEFIWTLSMCFEHTALVKPYTSRPANSERYWIGKGFQPSGATEWILRFFRFLTATDAPHGWDQLYAVQPAYPSAWLAQIQAFQEQVELHQYDKIQLTLNLIRAPTREIVLDLLVQNIANSRAWCHRHGITFNTKYYELSDLQVALLNLAEALGPFQASVARMNLPVLFRPPPTHRAWISPLSQSPPTGPAWRTALPASVLGREPLQIVGGTPPSPLQAPVQSPPLIDPAPEPL